MATIGKKSSKRLSKREKEMIAFEKRIKERNIKNHEALAFGLVDLIAKNTRIEWEIVHRYLERNHKRMVDETPEEREYTERMTKKIIEKQKKSKTKNDG